MRERKEAHELTRLITKASQKSLVELVLGKMGEERSSSLFSEVIRIGVYSVLCS